VIVTHDSTLVKRCGRTIAMHSGQVGEAARTA